MKQPDWHSAEMEARRTKVRKLWRIDEKLGQPPSKADMASDMVLAEMKFACPNIERSWTVASHARNWIETGNPFYIDAAEYLCRLEGIAMPPALAELSANVAEKRFKDEIRGGTAKQIRKENAEQYALTMMMRFRALGATADVAASKVAQHLSDMQCGIQFKASTLQKYYADVWQRSEQELRETYALEPSLRAQWQAVLDALPEANEDLKGNRRD